MNTIHLYPSLGQKWASASTAGFGSSEFWADIAAKNAPSTLHFHPSEAAARAAAAAEQSKGGEPYRLQHHDDNIQERLYQAMRGELDAVKIERDAWKQRCELSDAGLAVAREDAESHKSDLLACQRENERLRNENTSLKATIEDIHDRTHL